MSSSYCEELLDELDEMLLEELDEEVALVPLLEEDDELELVSALLEDDSEVISSLLLELSKIDEEKVALDCPEQALTRSTRNKHVRLFVFFISYLRNLEGLM